MGKFYSKNIAEIVGDIIARGGWKYTFDDHKGIFTFVMEAKGRKGRVDYLDYMIKIGKGEYLIYVIFPLLADVKNKKEDVCTG